MSPHTKDRNILACRGLEFRAEGFRELQSGMKLGGLKDP